MLLYLWWEIYGRKDIVTILVHASYICIVIQISASIVHACQHPVIMASVLKTFLYLHAMNGIPSCMHANEHI